jgi:hypothetical protein
LEFRYNVVVESFEEAWGMELKSFTEDWDLETKKEQE